MEENGSGYLGKRTGGIFLALAIWLIPVGAVYLARNLWLPPLASEHGAGIDRMFRYLYSTVGALFIIGHAVLGYFVWRFSRQDRISFRLGTLQSERKWSAFPAVVMALVAEGGILVLGLPVWGKVYDAAPPPQSVTIEITAEQFAWNVRYAGKDGVFGRTEPKLITLDNVLGMDPTDPAGQDDIQSLNDIWAPANVPVHIRLSSKDVIHSFFLPNFRFKQDVVPGLTVDFWFVPTQTGTFEIACTELCGIGHYQMRGLFHVLPPQQYQKWLSEQVAGQ